ncbi:MAG: hypothetical protein ACOC0P_07680 [Planctomycetota bacterium]
MFLRSVFAPGADDLAQLAVGIHGCGLLCANLPQGSVARFRMIAQSLVGMYESSTISDGMRTCAGSLSYQEPPVVPSA